MVIFSYSYSSATSEIIVICDILSGWACFAYIEIRYNSLKRLFYPDYFWKNIFLSSSLCLRIVVRLVVKTFIFLVAAERFSTPLQLATEPILRQQCTVAVAVVLLINPLRRWTLLLLILNTNYSHLIMINTAIQSTDKNVWLFSQYDVIDLQNVYKFPGVHF